MVKDKRDCYANLHAAFYREEDACRTLLEHKDAVDWDKAFQLQGKAWALAISFPPLGDFGKCEKPACSLKSSQRGEIYKLMQLSIIHITTIFLWLGNVSVPPSCRELGAERR